MQVCRDCMGEDTYALKSVEIPVTVGANTALITVGALVCSQSGNQLIDEDVANVLEAVFDRLKAGDTAGMEPVGTVYRVKQTATEAGATGQIP